MKKVLQNWMHLNASNSKTRIFLFLLLFGFSFSQAQIVINEVKENGSVELKNLGTSTVDVSGYWLCDFPSYRQMSNLNVVSGNLNMPANSFLVVDDFNFIDSADGELGLYTTNSFSSSTALIDYIEWGSTGHQRSGVAVAAGIWTTGSFIPAFDDALSIQYDGSGDLSSDFFPIPDTLGAENGICPAEAGSISYNGGTDVVICVDGNTDLLTIDIIGSAGTNEAYIITNSLTGEILFLPVASNLDPDVLGVGTCNLNYIKYEDGLTGLEIGEDISDLAGCFDLSNTISIIREAADGGSVAIDLGATGNPNNTTSFNSATEAVICVDTQADPLVITHENPLASNLSYRYVITNEDSSEILNIVNTNTIDLNGAGVGTCLIWGWSYRGMADNGASFIGGPLADLQAADCSDLSDNAVTVIREAADGGSVAIDLVATGNPNNTTSFNSATEAVICVDTQADPLVITHENPLASNLSYRYVITNEDSSEILNIVNTNTIDLNGAGVGTCLIWGWSYRGMADNGASFIGGPLADLQAADCSDLSDNAVTVIREAADGGSVAIDLVATGNPNNTTSFNSATEAVICVDTQADPLVITHENPLASNLSYRYVITNEDSSEILNIVNTNTIDLNGAGVGTCLIWGWSYRGMADNGASFIGGPLADLQAADCSDLSDNAVTVIREAADGGTISLVGGGTTFTGSAGNIVFDVEHATTAANLSYWYIITDENDNILEFQNSTVGNTLDLSAAPAGECHVWGWSYRGQPNPVVGDNISTLSDDQCEDISSNWITVIRDSVLSVDDFENTIEFKVYPNPTSDILNIKNGFNQSLDVNIELYDISGRRVYANATELNTTLQINVSTFEAGVYLLNVTDRNNNTTITKRVIKR